MGSFPVIQIKMLMRQFIKKFLFDEVLDQELGVVDLNAFCQCRDYDMPLHVFNINKDNALLNVLMGRDEGTLV